MRKRVAGGSLPLSFLLQLKAYFYPPGVFLALVSARLLNFTRIPQSTALRTLPIRLRLPELEDQTWFPSILRRYQTDLLGITAKTLGLYDPLSMAIAAQTSEGSTICDLCSGNGYASMAATEGARKSGAKLVLTDKFPNLDYFAYSNAASVLYIPHAIDVIADPLPKADFYTLFNGLHHFSVPQIKILLTKVNASGGKALFAEPIQPSVISLIKVLIATILGALILSPSIRPLRWYHIIFTYVLPLGLMVSFYDGIISVAKSYRRNTLQDLAAELRIEHPEIRFRVYRGTFATLYMLQT